MTDNKASDGLEYAISVLRDLKRRVPETLKICDIDALIMNELNPALVSARKFWPHLQSLHRIIERQEAQLAAVSTVPKGSVAPASSQTEQPDHSEIAARLRFAMTDGAGNESAWVKNPGWQDVVRAMTDAAAALTSTGTARAVPEGMVPRHVYTKEPGGRLYYDKTTRTIRNELGTISLQIGEQEADMFAAAHVPPTGQGAQRASKEHPMTLDPATPREAARICEQMTGDNLCTPIGFARGNQARDCADRLRAIAAEIEQNAAGQEPTGSATAEDGKARQSASQEAGSASSQSSGVQASSPAPAAPSETPRTDAAVECLPIYGPPESEWVSAEFARKLERKLAAAHAELAAQYLLLFKQPGMVMVPRPIAAYYIYKYSVQLVYETEEQVQHAVSAFAAAKEKS